MSKQDKQGASAPDPAPDPPDFADYCRLLGTVSIGEREYPIDVPAIDQWITSQKLPEETLERFQRKRSAAVAAYAANADHALIERLEELHQLVHHLQALPLAHQGAKHGLQQRQRAAKPRGRLVEDGPTMYELVRSLATAHHNIELSAKELWPLLWSALEELGLEPAEHAEGEDPKKWRYDYQFNGGIKPLTFGTFEGHVSKARKSG